MEVGRSSRYFSLGGSALGVVLKLSEEDSNDLSRIALDSSSGFHPLPPLGSNLPLYTEVGQVHGGLG